MTIRIGINGFGRMGHLALRAAWGWPDLTFAHINEPGEADTAAHLLHSTRCMVAGPNDTQLTVCDSANETCPTFPHARTRRHWSIADPSGVQGSDAERLAAFRRACDMRYASGTKPRYWGCVGRMLLHRTLRSSRRADKEGMVWHIQRHYRNQRG